MGDVHRCLDCKFAEWKLTVSGRLHPSGDGFCGWEYKPPVIAAAFHWGYPVFGIAKKLGPSPVGGDINRREPIAQCPVYQRREAE